MRNSGPARTAWLGLLTAAGLAAVPGCGPGAGTPPRVASPAASPAVSPAISTGPSRDPALDSLVDTWNLDCGDDFWVYSLVVRPDYGGVFSWRHFDDPASPSETTDHVTVRLSAESNKIIATTLTADHELSPVGARTEIRVEDVNTITLVTGDGSLTDLDAVLHRSAVHHVEDCGGD